VKAENDISQMVVSIGDLKKDNEENIKSYCEVLREITSKVLKTRAFGASCVDFTFLASGKTSGYIMPYFHPWDIVPGILIAEESGLIVSHTDII